MVGETVGQYRIISELGRGRFGITYRGEHISIPKAFGIIKHLYPELTQDPQFLRRFTHEAENIVRLYHTNLASVLGLISQEGNYFYIAEDVPGHNLTEYLTRKEKLSPSHAVEIIAELCNALEYLHNRQYYHQHLHPGNVVISKTGQVKLTDFGIAMLLGEIGVTKALRQPESSFPEYIAPEQKLGNPFTEQTDVFPLGVMLYELITGDVFDSHKPNPVLPPAIQKMIAKSTAKIPAERYATVTDLNADASQFLAFQASMVGKPGQPIEPQPIIEIPPALEPSRIRPFWWTTWSLGLAVILMGLFYFLFWSRGYLPTTSLPRGIPFKREVLPFSKAPEETIAEETTLLKPEKAALIKEETAFEMEAPTPGIPTQVISITTTKPWIQEEASYAERTTGFEKKEALEKGESLNIPKEENMMPYTTSPTPTVTMVVPSGNFTMGSNSGNLDEAPAQQVFVDTFLIDMFEVNNSQYQEFITATGHSAPATWGKGFFLVGQANSPVVNVTWSDASAYAAWIGARLPTEAEWEKAARGTDARTYPWGSQFISNVCNYQGANFGGLTPIGMFPLGRSPCGCSDMAGNAAEWTSSLYQPYAGNTTASLFAGYGLDYRVVRGGAYNSNQDGVRTSRREPRQVNGGYPDVGFRTVRPLGGIPAVANNTVISPKAIVRRENSILFDLGFIY